MRVRVKNLTRAVRRLDAAERRFVVQASAMAMALPPLLRLLPLPRLMAWMSTRGPREAHLSPVRMAQLTDHVLKQGRGPFRANCVVRSLILFRHLDGRSGKASVQFGVRRDGRGEFDGHAWVCVEGKPFAETEDPLPLYNVTYIFPPEQP